MAANDYSHTHRITKEEFSSGFMLRRQVIKLYRDILRSIKQVPDKESQKELKQWARQDFEKNKHHTEEITIKMMIKHGERSLKELQQTLDLSAAK